MTARTARSTTRWLTLLTAALTAVVSRQGHGQTTTTLQPGKSITVRAAR
jgi:hypothetical protein